MQNALSNLIPDIRSASRDLVRELGFMGRTLAGTNLPPSAVHAIIEIGAAGELSAKILSRKLRLDKSTISRVVKSLVKKGDVGETRSKADARAKQLHLTGQGKKTLAAINRYADRQVAAAIDPLDDQSRLEILAGLQKYSEALATSENTNTATAPGHQAVICAGYRPGIIGRTVEMHAAFYSKSAEFGAVFETTVAIGLADFVTRLGSPKNDIWYALGNNKIVGAIAIDGEDLGDGQAHLRWFIVDDEIRGGGTGKLLLRKAIAFCDEQNFRETRLWTFEVLGAARYLYESHGFTLADEHYGDQWGVKILEQEFIRPRPVTN